MTGKEGLIAVSNSKATTPSSAGVAQPGSCRGKSNEQKGLAGGDSPQLRRHFFSSRSITHRLRRLHRFGRRFVPSSGARFFDRHWDALHGIGRTVSAFGGGMVSTEHGNSRSNRSAVEPSTM